MKNSLSLTALCAALAFAFSPAAAAAAPPPAGKVSGAASEQARMQVDAIADAYYDSVARFKPVDATDSGDNRFDDQIGLAISPTLRTRHFAQLRGFQKRLRAIDRMELTTGARSITTSSISSWRRR